MNFFDHKGLGNHLLQLCPKVVKHPVYTVGTLASGVGRTEVGAQGRLIISLPLKPVFIKRFRARTGMANLYKATCQNYVDDFRRNFFARGNLITAAFSIILVTS